MKITKAQIEKCLRLKACEPGLNYITAKPRTWKGLAEHRPDCYLWTVSYGIHLDKELLDSCAKKESSTAVEYAAKYLTPERLDECRAIIRSREVQNETN